MKLHTSLFSVGSVKGVGFEPEFISLPKRNLTRRGASPGGGGRVGKSLKSELSSHRVDSSRPTEKNKGTEESAAVFNFSQSTKQIQLFLFHMCSRCLF